tara:strand:+ start:7564 stop:8016 length:453 start_codon:yes stop_codon:yes gene_type:complete
MGFIKLDSKVIPCYTWDQKVRDQIMGIRSDVFVAVKNHIFLNLKEETQKFLAESSDQTSIKPLEGRAFIFESVKWYVEDNPEIIELYEALRYLISSPENGFSEEDFIIIEACGEYPDHEENNLGAWTDNPWEAYKEISVSINVNDPHAFD